MSSPNVNQWKKNHSINKSCWCSWTKEQFFCLFVFFSTSSIDLQVTLGVALCVGFLTVYVYWDFWHWTSDSRFWHFFLSPGFLSLDLGFVHFLWKSRCHINFLNRKWYKQFQFTFRHTFLFYLNNYTSSHFYLHYKCFHDYTI